MTSTTSFGVWVRQRRKAVALTQVALAQRAHCSLITIKKIEADERRPSERVAELLADHLQMTGTDRATFLRVARGVQAAERLHDPTAIPIADQPTSTPPPHNLPAQLTPLLGRESELNELQQLLLDPAVRLLTIVGPGGIGKTHLAIAAAGHLLTPTRAAFADGIYFVPLAALSVSSSIVTAMADALRFTFAGSSNLPQQLCDYLRPKHLLLVLDNFEHLLDGVPLVVLLLETIPGLKLLVTSRIRLQVRCEQRFPLTGLAYPDPVRGENMAPQLYSAVQLFLQQARRAQPHFTPTTDDWRAIGQICAQMEGTPLGILLAASWLGLQTPTTIATAIAHNLLLLQSDWQDLPDRQKSLHAIFEHSWRLLDQHTQAIFAQLALFCGGFTYAAAEQVAASTRTALMQLLDLALLRQDEQGRFDLHELVRQYAAEKLAQRPDDAQSTRNRHSAYYLTLVQPYAADLQTGYQPARLAALDVEAENIRTAWRWAAMQRQAAWLAQAHYSIGRYHELRYRFHEGEALFRMAAEEMDMYLAQAPCSTATDILLLARLLAWQGSFSRELEQIEQASQLLQASQAWFAHPLLAGMATARDKADLLLQQGRIAALSDRAQARYCYQQSLAYYEALGDRHTMAGVLALLADVAWNTGDHAEAQRLLEQSLTIQQELGDQTGMAWSLDLLGAILLHLGKSTEAEECQRRSLAIFMTAGHAGAIAHELTHLGVTLVLCGKFAEARTLLAQRITVYGEVGSSSALALTHDTVAAAYLHQGEYGQAYTHAQQSLALARAVHNRRQIALSLVTLGQVFLATGDYTAAANSFRESLAIGREMGEMTGWPLACLGYLACVQTHLPQAQAYLMEALGVALDTRMPFTVLLTLPAAALLFADHGQLTYGLELYGLSTQYPLVANSCWFAAVAERRLIQLTASLPPTVIAVAQTKGRTLDLWQTATTLLAAMNNIECP